MTQRRAELQAWAALLLAPAAWSVYALAAWAAVPLACREGLMPVLHVAALVLLAAAAGGLLLAVRERRERGGSLGATIAVALAALFTLGLLLFAVVNVAVDPCR